MMGLHAVFVTLLLIFVVLGAFRGWVKEILVTASTVWGVALINVLDTFVGIFPDTPAALTPPFDEPTNVVVVAPTDEYRAAFFARMVVFLVVVAFGYHSPRISRLAARTRRETIRDGLVGGMLGLFNGYLILSTLWFYLATTGYPLNFVVPPRTSLRLFCCQPLPAAVDPNPLNLPADQGVPRVDLTDNEAVTRLQIMSVNAVENEETVLRWSLPNMVGMPYILILALVMSLFIIMVLV